MSQSLAKPDGGENDDRLPKWIKPQLTRLVNEAPAGGGWLHEIKYDDYRMHPRIKALHQLDNSGPRRCKIRICVWAVGLCSPD
jgi:hypothetical protein